MYAIANATRSAKHIESPRRTECDLIRAAAILLILAVHTGNYTYNVKMPIGNLLAELGLSLFFFISGYVLAMKYPVFSHVGEIRSFLLKRVLRLYPLYVPALFLFVLLFAQLGIWDQWTLPRRLLTIVVHLVGAQILLSPAISPMNTLWFVGCITAYYLVYGILAWYGSTVKKLIAAATTVFMVAALIKCLTGFIEYRFFYYYPIFTGGVLYVRMQMPMLEAKGSSAQRIVGISLGFFGMILAGAFLCMRGCDMHDFAGSRLKSFVVAESICMLFSVSGVMFSTCLAPIVALRLHERTLALVLFLSASSYAMYLFHRPILALLASGCRVVMGTTGYSFDLAVIGIGFPLTLAASYYLQRSSDTLVRLLRR